MTLGRDGPDGGRGRFARLVLRVGGGHDDRQLVPHVFLRKNQRQQRQTMNDSQQWKQYPGFGALDWASEKHSVIVVDQAGKVIEDFEIEHSALGWKKFREKLQAHGSIPFAIETSQGAAVEQLLEAAMIVYPLNPKSAQAYRERKAPSGVKDDRLDAWSFADALRVDGQDWKALRPEEPLSQRIAFSLSG